ncbi:hypothetical protein EYE40_03950 [Glaciihabitans arcticus]|uniref:Uncharacterized protein n=1 Tax=Glaciihabitans arcticus TaxID=2668039 RepID=A0A4Q9GPD4_9MICO|nr:hypothetical protein [Glaciihabitans arcticus]TBN56616.1 hypothetical protein EYE40_03950 [Glaciihabitans arcticus]
MRRGWWRRNGVAVAVITVSVPGLIWLLGGVILTERLANEPAVTLVDAGDSTQLAGYRFTLTASDTFDPRDPEGETRPVGAELVAAILSVEPIAGEAQEDASCTATLTAPGPERLRRTWERLGSPGDYLYRLADDTKSACVLDGTAFEYELVFLAPTGTYDVASIDLTLDGERTIHRLQLEQ